jgi:hypothetical protein
VNRRFQIGLATAVAVGITAALLAVSLRPSSAPIELERPWPPGVVRACIQEAGARIGGSDPTYIGDPSVAPIQVGAGGGRVDLLVSVTANDAEHIADDHADARVVNNVTWWPLEDQERAAVDALIRKCVA